MQQKHKEMQHHLMSMPLDSTVWAHAYLMCKHGFDARLAVDKLLEIIEEKGVTVRLPMVLLTTIDVETAGRVRELAMLKSSSEQLRELNAVREHAFIVWFEGDKKINTELEMIH